MTLTADFVNNHPARSVLGQGDTESARRENAYRFTTTVAIDANAAEGRIRYGVLYKPNGVNVEGRSADRIHDRETGDHFDVVFASEAPHAVPSFNNDGPAPLMDWRAPNPAYYVGGPAPVPGPTPTPTPIPPVPVPPPSDDVLAEVRRVAAMVGVLQADFDRVFRR